MIKINSSAFGFATGIFVVIWEIFFFAAIIVFPGVTLNFISRLFSIRVATLSATLTWGNVLMSVVSGFILGFIAGCAFAAVYNLFDNIDENYPVSSPEPEENIPDKPPIFEENA